MLALFEEAAGRLGSPARSSVAAGERLVILSASALCFLADWRQLEAGVRAISTFEAFVFVLARPLALLPPMEKKAITRGRASGNLASGLFEPRVSTIISYQPSLAVGT